MALFRKNRDSEGYLKSRFKLGLALSGGGTRGIAHLGVLKAFEEHKIRFDYVAGTSVGSLVGAIYCAGLPLDEVILQAKNVTRKELIDRRFVLGSSSSNIAKLADGFLKGKNFDELSVPFACVAVDIVNGSEIVLDSGNLAKAISASCAVPALFTPVELDGLSLVDGGLLNNMPADICRRMGADIVVGVDLNHNRGNVGSRPRNVIDTLISTWNITTKSTMYKGQMNSDVIVEPELAEYRNTSLRNFDERVNEGYKAAIAVMNELKELLHVK